MKKIIKKNIVVFLCVLCALCGGKNILVSPVRSEVLERIVAIVNDRAILLSEYNEKLLSARQSDPGASGENVLNNMIDRILLVEQAGRLRLGNSDRPDEIRDDDALIKEYIERRIKSFIHIPIEEIEAYYENSRESFGKREFHEVKDEIEESLVNRELEKKVLGHVEELRKKAYIRIQLKVK